MSAPRKTDKFVYALMALFIAVAAVLVFLLIRSMGQEDDDCENRGGVLLRGRSTAVCVDRDAVIP